MKDLAGALAMLKEYEGCFPFMYLDSRGYVTVGVGFWLDTADHAANYVFYVNCKPPVSPCKATTDEVRAEWARLKCQTPDRLETYYEQFTTLHMQQSDIDLLLSEKICSFEKVARETFVDWDAFPAVAQLALLDMIYNLGSLCDFPKLVGYARKKDWANCAHECWRLGPGAERNEETRERFLEAAREQPLMGSRRRRGRDEWRLS